MSKKDKKLEVTGLLCSYFETGMEGVAWTIYDQDFMSKTDQYRSHDGIHYFRSADYLIIYEKDTKPEDGKILWEGPLDFHYSWDKLPLAKTQKGHSYGYAQYPQNPQYGQLQIGGMWVHQIPKKIDLDLWVDIFINNDDKYWGKLVKREVVLKGRK